MIGKKHVMIKLRKNNEIDIKNLDSTYCLGQVLN
jgi:hypothetical protein